MTTYNEKEMYVCFENLYYLQGTQNRHIIKTLGLENEEIDYDITIELKVVAYRSELPYDLNVDSSAFEVALPVPEVRSEWRHLVKLTDKGYSRYSRAVIKVHSAELYVATIKLWRYLNDLASKTIKHDEFVILKKNKLATFNELVYKVLAANVSKDSNDGYVTDDDDDDGYDYESDDEDNI